MYFEDTRLANRKRNYSSENASFRKPSASLDDALTELNGLFNLERISKRQASDPALGLKRIRRLAELLGIRTQSDKFLHVAGTKGKGSTCHMLEAVLRAHGFRTGLYTSPHLEDIRERIRIDGEPIAPADFLDVLNRTLDAAAVMQHDVPPDPPSYFEVLTAAGLLHFQRARVDFVVLETGLGGRLDSTNIVTPAVAVITRIAVDHADKLGHTIPKIAGEKAGIIKPGVPVVVAANSGEARDVFIARAAQNNSPLIVDGRDYRVRHRKNSDSFDFRGRYRSVKELALVSPGSFQADNAGAAIAALEVLEEKELIRIDESILKKSLAKLRIPGRLESFSVDGRQVVIDGAHNLIAINTAYREMLRHFRPTSVVTLAGMARNKRYRMMLRTITRHSRRVVLTQPQNHPRMMNREDYESRAGIRWDEKFEYVQDEYAALARVLAIAAPGETVMITGSFWLIGDLRRKLCERGG